MILVQGGTFTMGGTEMEGEEDEHPAHEVTVSTFSISKYTIQEVNIKHIVRPLGLALKDKG